MEVLNLPSSVMNRLAHLEALLPWNPFHPTPDGHVWLKQFRGLILVVDGNIGGGKSTLINILVDYLRVRGHNCVAIPETFDHVLLERMIDALSSTPDGTPAEAVYDFQMDMLRRRKEAYLQAQRMSREGLTVFLDRSLAGDTVFARAHAMHGRLTDAQWQAYAASVCASNVMTPDAIVFLDCTVECLQSRIRTRNRAKEDQYSADYLAEINALYRTMYSEAQAPYPLVRVDWSKERNLTSNPVRDEMAYAVFKGVEQLLHADRGKLPQPRTLTISA